MGSIAATFAILLLGVVSTCRECTFASAEYRPFWAVFARDVADNALLNIDARPRSCVYSKTRPLFLPRTQQHVPAGGSLIANGVPGSLPASLTSGDSPLEEIAFASRIALENLDLVSIARSQEVEAVWLPTHRTIQRQPSHSTWLLQHRLTPQLQQVKNTCCIIYSGAQLGAEVPNGGPDVKHVARPFVTNQGKVDAYVHNSSPSVLCTLDML